MDPELPESSAIPADKRHSPYLVGNIINVPQSAFNASARWHSALLACNFGPESLNIDDTKASGPGSGFHSSSDKSRNALLIEHKATVMRQLALLVYDIHVWVFSLDGYNTDPYVDNGDSDCDTGRLTCKPRARSSAPGAMNAPCLRRAKPGPSFP